MSSSAARRSRGTGRVLWGRIGVMLLALLATFGLGRCSVDEGVPRADYDAAQARIGELEQRARDLEQNQVALAAGGIDVTPAPAVAEGEQQEGEQATAEPGVTPTEAATGALTGGGEYTVREGDTLETIAQQVYGDGTLFNLIEQENAVDTTQLQVGQTLRIPPLPQQG